MRFMAALSDSLRGDGQIIQRILTSSLVLLTNLGEDASESGRSPITEDLTRPSASMVIDPLGPDCTLAIPDPLVALGEGFSAE
jgi:hypothetical protein